MFYIILISGVGVFFHQNLAWCGDMISNFSGHCLDALGIIKKEQLVTYICF